MSDITVRKHETVKREADDGIKWVNKSISEKPAGNGRLWEQEWKILLRRRSPEQMEKTGLSGDWLTQASDTLTGF